MDLKIQDLRRGLVRHFMHLFLFISITAIATAERGAPGSLLIFPEYDNRPGALTMVTVTNTNLQDTILVEYNYVGEGSCSVTPYIEVLQPGDQLSLMTFAHHDSDDRGYLYVFARGFVGPLAFDYLVGSSMAMGVFGHLYEGMEPFAYRAGEGLQDFEDTDLDGDGLRDFDGLEYEPSPNTLHIPRFFGQVGGEYESELILINLTGAAQFDTRIDFQIYNDDADKYSATHVFSCWERVALADISSIFKDSVLRNSTSHDPAEPVGMTGWETGWFQMNSVWANSGQQTIENPAFLATLVGVDDDTSRFAVMPFATGQNTRGSLFQTGATIGSPPGIQTCGGGSLCPCNNSSGWSGGGCRNSTGFGALLDAVGTNSFLQDDLKLVVSQAPPSTSGFFLQGGSAIELPFADGMLCVGPPTRRLQFAATSASGEASSTTALASFVIPGETVRYQFWFREPGNAGPCGSPSSFSNAYEVTWN